MTSIRHFICCCTTKKKKNGWRQKPASLDHHASTMKGFELKMVKLTIWFVFSVFYWQYFKHYSYKYKLCSLGERLYYKDEIYSRTDRPHPPPPVPPLRSARQNMCLLQIWDINSRQPNPRQQISRYIS